MNEEVYKIDWGPKPNTRFFAFVPEKYHGLKHHKFSRLANTLSVKYQMMMHHLEPGSLIWEPCSGSGFGAEMLVKSGYNVVCVENNKFLAQMNRIRKLQVFEEDMLTFKLKDNTFDGIVFIDAIEHFEEENQTEILNLFHKSLRPGGVLVIDTPCAPKTGYVNKHHLRELNWEDFGVFVSGKFKIEKRFILIWDNEMVLPLRKDGATQQEIHNIMTTGMAIDQVIIARKYDS